MEKKFIFVIAAIVAIIVVIAVVLYPNEQPEEGKPPGAPEIYHDLSIQGCNKTHVLVRNIWREPATKDADISNESGVLVAYIDFSNYPLQPKELGWIPLSEPIKEGTYVLTDSDYAANEFTC